ncbi:hypothetical protein COV82_04090 [Candidatus Peregrinibacteria bacterium CG11_big_fil_rev_8_21_14_0_20_46_8]|nr:MAG: hypothetical protein COV82_04090 [Candidatus Peregrinibacteria bacterium CG11_big_fil_rev_8_21_14_0_20_46_8]
MKIKKSFWQLEFGGVKSTDIMLMTKHLSVALTSGLTLVEGLEMIYEQSAGRLKRIVADILSIVQSGKAFYEALMQYSQFFTPIYINMVKTGEATGTLDDNLQKLAETLRRSYELKKKVKSALMYPALIFVAILGLGFSVSFFVLPRIIPLFQSIDVDLPISTRILLFFANFVKDHFIVLAISMPIFVIGFFILLRRDFIKPLTHRIILMLPIVKPIVININLARFAQTLGALLTSGMTLDTSLYIATDATANRVYKKAIAGVIPQIQKGKTLSTGLSYYPKLFPPLVTHMIAMGERTGNLDKSLSYLNEYYEGEVDSTMKNLSTVLEPVLLIGIGLLVGFVAIAILSPIYQITGSIRQ